MRFDIPNVRSDLLFEAILEPTATTVKKAAEDSGTGEGEIVARNQKNRVAVGVPYFENLVSRLNNKHEEIPYEIRQMMDQYDFHFVSLSCSFWPDSHAKFTWARFGIALNAKSKSGEPLAEKPIAYDIFPSDVTSQIKYSRETKFEAGLKFSFGPATVDPVSGSSTKTEEYLVYEPEIFAFGLRRSEVAWNFSSTKEKSLYGNKKDLLIIVRAPKDSKITGRFLLGAEVEFSIGKLIHLPLVRRDDKAVQIEYDLST